MVLACLICKMTFNDKIDCENYCDNCMFNIREVGQVLVFEAYDLIAKLGMMYTDTTEYSNLLLSGERQRLFVRNPPRKSKTVAKQTYAYEEALNNFAL